MAASVGHQQVHRIHDGLRRQAQPARVPHRTLQVALAVPPAAAGGNSDLGNGIGGPPQKRQPFNTNVNAPTRPGPLPGLPLPSFLYPPRPLQPGASLTPPVEGAFKASGKTVVITGGSQGIGRATALLFARKGYNVVVAARDATKLAYVVEDCAKAAGRAGAALAVPMDVTQERQVQDLANAVVARFERVDVLVNNAGVFARGRFADTPASEAKRLMETNYLGPYMVTQAFMPYLLRSADLARGSVGGERPSVIMVSSFMGKVPTKYMSAFSASKAALAALATAVRTEVSPSGVHVGVVQPGIVKSSLMERSAFYGKDSEEDRRVFRQLLRALPVAQTPAEVAEAIYNCATSKQDEVVVGLPFAAAAHAYSWTGLNPSSVPFA